MKRKSRLPELLAPAGDFECLVAAVRGGADAVYIGGKAFSARAYAKNFDNDEIKRAVSYCHLHGVKLYVTMNTLLYNDELSEALAFASQLYALGVDALIVADVGLISLIRERIPGFELHASTQMSVHNSIGADCAYNMGCTRVVLARELSGEDISAVTQKCLAETEVFLHGALCVCHSGQCLFSSMIGGRSGNRGECAQPCRLPYNNGKYILSLNDLSLAHHVTELIDAGVASLKIEGRMKSPDYVYTVTSIYRRLLDEYRNSRAGEDKRLEQAFSREGFTDGYFVGNTFSKMTGVRSAGDKEASRLVECGDFTPDRVPVKARAEIRLGVPSVMEIYTEGENPRSVRVLGECASPAINAPLTESAVKARLAKMGNTFLALDESDIELVLDEGVNLSPGLINALRREAAEKFEDFTREAPKVVTDAVLTVEDDDRVKNYGKNTAIFMKSSLIDASSSKRALDYFDLIFAPLMGWESHGGTVTGVYLPPIIMERELSEVRQMLADASGNGAKYALVGNLSHVDLARKAGLIAFGDFRLNVCNTSARLAYADMGVSDLVLSPELTSRQAREVGGRAVVYGRIPLMITERCFMKDNFGCDKCERCSLVDRKGIAFPMMREYGHRNIILNSAITYMADKMNELPQSVVGGRHFIFTTESPNNVVTAVEAFKGESKFPFDSVPLRRMGKRSV